MPSEPSGLSRAVFCSLRTDLDRIAADLTGASRIALDIGTTVSTCYGNHWKAEHDGSTAKGMKHVFTLRTRCTYKLIKKSA
jgi:hypothetical protein